jgi:RimJ/RimL family protein N-acetyltransferase
MIQALPIARAAQALPLFQRLTQSQPMCAAVLEGVYPGKVYVDNSPGARTALLTTYIESEARGTWCFLAGEPANDSFNQALNEAIYSRQIMAPDVPILLFSCDPDDWGGQMDAVLAPRPPIWIRRYRFVSRGVGFDRQATLPPGHTVERMDEELRQVPGLGLPEDVAATIEKWEAMADPRFSDFGFVVLDRSNPEPVIASWATVDFVVAGAGDLGFFTQPEYRRRGLGTVAACAALEQGFALGLHEVNWTCDVENPGSTATAQKLGLERVEEYHQAVLIMDEARHMSFFRQQGG